MMKYKGVCEQCGTVIESKHKSTLKRFCSHKCSNQWKWDNVRSRVEYISNPCLYCGKIIKVKKTDHRVKEEQVNWFCNHKCESKYRISQRKIQKCPVCGCDFYKPKQKTCSAKCGYELNKFNTYCRRNNLKDISYKYYLELKTTDELIRAEFIANSLKVTMPNGAIRYYKQEKFVYSGNEKEYYKKYNKDHSKQRYKKHAERMKTDEVYRFKHKMRNFIYSSFKRKNLPKVDKTENILGCSLEYFKQYIASKFRKGMTFDNYGKWQIDHIIPLSTAKTVEDVIRLCHYTNLQPLWANENRRKSNKLNFKI